MKKSDRYAMLKRALCAAFPKTVPILAGFLFLGASYGVYMRAGGFAPWYPILMSVVIFGGSLEFVTVSMLLSAYAPLQTLLTALMIQARHLFYGVAMLEKYRDIGKKRFYCIYALCDESFSINCSADVPPDVDRGWFFFFVSLLDHCYWITGAALGALLGSFLHFNTHGLDFVMTAMFVVIFLEQWLKEKQHYSALIGVGCALLCRIAFGSDSFLVPTMVCILVFLSLLRRPIEQKEAKQ